jgi:peptide/nickel transport system substrate-binding protein
VQDGGKFTWPLGQLPPTFNYNHLDGTLQDNQRVIAALMPVTFTNDSDGTPIWSSDYLASPPTLVSSPKQVVTYNINPKAVWYDGTPITWEDFYWQWQAQGTGDARYRIASASGYDYVESVVRGKDDREVVVTFKKPFASWQNVFSYFYPASTNRDPQIFNEGWRNAPLTTAGPFKLAGINRTAQTITLVRNEKWWGEPAKLDTIIFRAVEQRSQIDALANGEVDGTDMGPDANAYARARTIAGVEVRMAGGPNFRHITINGSSANMQDVRVRRALAMGIDRTTIARVMLTPLGITPQSLNNHIYMANQDGYQNNAGNIGEYNPNGAKALLEEAGWKMEGSLYMKDGKPLEINLAIPAGVPASKQESELVQNMLGQIGVTVKLNTVPQNDFFDKYVTPGEFDFTVFSWMGTAYPVMDAKSLYGQPAMRADGSLDVRQNYARIGSPDIDSLLDAANSELDRNAATALANRVDSLIWHEVHSLTLYQRPELIAVRQNLVNFGAFGFAAPWVYQDIGWKKQ